MQFFSSGFFWLLEGLLFCLAIIGFKKWTEDRGVAMSPWRWFLVIVWILFAGFTIAFIGTSLGEGEPTAALRGGLIFGALSVVTFFAILRMIGLLGKS